MKRKLKCGTCGTTKNKATGKTLYMFGDSPASMMILPDSIECWDCGEARREAEEKKKQERNKSLVDKFAVESDKLARGVEHW